MSHSSIITIVSKGLIQFVRCNTDISAYFKAYYIEAFAPFLDFPEILCLPAMPTSFFVLWKHDLTKFNSFQFNFFLFLQKNLDVDLNTDSQAMP